MRTRSVEKIRVVIVLRARHCVVASCVVSLFIKSIHWSIRYGYSIGGFDADKFEGDTLTLGIGKAGEPYEGIGRGELNIEGMPVYRDAVGGVGTPTSDNERTKLSVETTRLLAIINGYSGKEGLQEAAEYMVELLKEYALATDVQLIPFE